MSSHINLKRESFYGIYTLLIPYMYTDQILFSNSSYRFPKYILRFFSVTFFSEIIQFNIYIFTLFLSVIWLRNLFPKYYTLLGKNHIHFWALVFEIHIDSKFQSRGEILKNIYHNHKFHFDCLAVFFYSFYIQVHRINYYNSYTMIMLFS